MPNFVYFAASIAELARGEKSCRPITHSPSLFDAPGTDASFRFGITSLANVTDTTNLGLLIRQVKLSSMSVL